MILFGIDFSIGALWLAAALVLAILELLAPGFFLIFVAARRGGHRVRRADARPTCS